MKSGDQCNRCFAGKFQTRSVRDGDRWHTRYLHCPKCGATGKETIPLHQVSRRQRPLKQSALANQ